MLFLQAGKKGVISLKKFILLYLFLAFALTGCSQKADTAKELQNPRAVITEQGVFHYGDTRETVEKILGKDSEAVVRLEYYRKYADDTEVLYRKVDGEECAVLMMVNLPKFTTYQDVSVGDNWNDVKERLGNVAEQSWAAAVLFDGDEQVDPYTRVEDCGDDWLKILYKLSDDGTIERITIYDTMAGYTYQ